MILRLFRAALRPAAETAVLRRLRQDTLPEIRTLEGLHAFTAGFRHADGRAEHLALSTWTDLASIETAAGSLDGSVVSTPSDDVFDGVAVDHFELVEPGDAEVVTLDGPVIGVVRGHVAPNADSTSLEAVRASRPELADAGVIALHIGRRVDGHRTELVILAVWRDRASLLRFAARRGGELIKTRFLQQLADWSFETWDCLSLDRLLIPSAGPAVLVADGSGRYVDASPGVERLLGVPGELLVGRTVADLTPPGLRDGFTSAWSAFLDARCQRGTYELCLPGGRGMRVRFHAAADVPEPGLHASVLSRPDEPEDERPIEETVALAFGPALAPAPEALEVAS